MKIILKHKRVGTEPPFWVNNPLDFIEVELIQFKKDTIAYHTKKGKKLRCLKIEKVEAIIP